MNKSRIEVLADTISETVKRVKSLVEETDPVQTKPVEYIYIVLFTENRYMGGFRFAKDSEDSFRKVFCSILPVYYIPITKKGYEFLNSLNPNLEFHLDEITEVAYELVKQTKKRIYEAIANKFALGDSISLEAESAAGGVLKMGKEDIEDIEDFMIEKQPTVFEGQFTSCEEISDNILRWYSKPGGPAARRSIFKTYDYTRFSECSSEISLIKINTKSPYTKRYLNEDAYLKPYQICGTMIPTIVENYDTEEQAIESIKKYLGE